MPPSPRRLSLNKSILAIAGIATLGLADALYLTLDHYFALPLPCTTTHGCETVLTSVYAMVGPVPLAAIGVAYYLLVAVYALYLYTSDELAAWKIKKMFALATIGFLASTAFVSIQAFLIGAYCIYCLFSAMCTVALFCVSVWLLRVGT